MDSTELISNGPRYVDVYKGLPRRSVSAQRQWWIEISTWMGMNTEKKAGCGGKNGLITGTEKRRRA
jgi:hypothetical protein